MAILEHEVRSAAPSVLTGSHRHLFSRANYYSMGEAGVFGDKRVELIEGEIIEMAPIGPPHAAMTHPLALLLQAAFGPGFTLRNQVPITIGDESNPSEPEPDVVVAAGSWRDYLTRHPGPNDTRLIVEISESTLAYDRTIKARLYSVARIPEYWIVNLVERQVEVHRQPTDTGYGDVSVYRVGESIAPLLASDKTIVVDEMLP